MGRRWEQIRSWRRERGGWSPASRQSRRWRQLTMSCLASVLCAGTDTAELRLNSRQCFQNAVNAGHYFPVIAIFVLARLMGQYCFARCRLSASSVVVCNAADGRPQRPPGAWVVGWPTLHGGPVQLRPVSAIFCLVQKL